MRAMPRSETVREPQEVLFVNLTEDRSHGMLSGRAMARSGLRMMPPFPSPSLKFRKAGFPRSGFKASISDRAFPSDREFVAALGLRPSFVLSASTVEFPVLCRRNVAR